MRPAAVVDGFAMVFRDGNLGRLCVIDVAPESLDAAALMALRLGGSDEHIPRLGDLLEMVAGRVPLLLELKHARGAISDADWERAWNIRRSGCDFVAVKLNRITDGWVAELRRAGLAALCWTVRSAADRETAQVHAGRHIWEGYGRP